jgi:hypothetical protein
MRFAIFATVARLQPVLTAPLTMRNRREASTQFLVPSVIFDPSPVSIFSRGL